MTSAVDLAERDAPVDSYARKALVASALGYAMDGFDLLILGFMLGDISKDLALTPAQSGSLVTMTLVGAVLGGIGFGMASDRFGRIRVLTWTILIFAVFTGLCALAQGYWDLLAYRTLAGLGLGGEFGIGMALVAEAWPASKRARASSYVGLGWQAGVLAAGLATVFLKPYIGWRGMFVLGLLPALVSFVMRRSVGEPQGFIEKIEANAQSSLGLLVKDGATARTSFGLFILCAVQNFGYYGLMIWMPNYLSAKLGFGLTKSVTWTLVTVLGMAFGIWLFGQLADRVGRRPIFSIFMIGAAAMALVYSRLEGEQALLIGGAALGMFVNGMLGGYGALMSELYPTEARATAQNVLFNLGRGVGGFGPVVMLALASSYSFSAAITVLALIYIVDLVALWAFIPERKGAALS
jgi:MFS family permease